MKAPTPRKLVPSVCAGDSVAANPKQASLEHGGVHSQQHQNQKIPGCKPSGPSLDHERARESRKSVETRIQIERHADASENANSTNAFSSREMNSKVAQSRFPDLPPDHLRLSGIIGVPAQLTEDMCRKRSETTHGAPEGSFGVCHSRKENPGKTWKKSEEFCVEKIETPKKWETSSSADVAITRKLTPKRSPNFTAAGKSAREIMSGFTDNQRAAVEASINQPLGIVAGPGSGKTMTLTSRLAAMLNQGVNPCQILALTFTRKAAEEMQVRVLRMAGIQDGLWIMTFHQFALKIIRYLYYLLQRSAPHIAF